MLDDRPLPANSDDAADKDDSRCCLTTLIKRQVDKTPHAPAVRMGLDTLSYCELQQRAHQLAARLDAAGAARGQRIGIMLPRSPDMVVAVVGVLALGAAYVPLDPEYPDERLRYQLRDAGIDLLIADTNLRSEALQFGGRVLALRDADPLPSSFSPRAASANDLAYVIYTSGSSGQPKGVMIEHGAVVNFIGWVRKTLAIGPADVVLSQASLSFDMSVLDLFVALTSGALLEIVPRHVVQNARELLALIRSSEATWLQATPSMWRLLVEAGLPATRTLGAIVGGEALSQELAEMLRQRLSEVWNFYGPTETTVYSSAARYEDGRPMIGRPIANTQIYLLDADRRLVPNGEPGELYISGRGLARGYLNKPELTAASFVELDLGSSSLRAYRTGDLARCTPEGCFEYLGRKDRQVKVRGYRIELGDIESHLRTLPGVRDCVVIARPDGVGVHRLLGYVMPVDHGSIIDCEELKDALRKRLPEYMVPSVVMLLDDIPLTPNLKVDEAALPDPTRRTCVGDPTLDPMSEPFDREERIIADIWTEVLEHPILSRHADFFDHGGHSLLALITIMHLEEAFDRTIPLDALWADGCTVAGMARLVRQLQGAAAPSRLVPIRPGRSDMPPLFVIHTARGSVNEYFALSHQMGARHAVVGVRARGVFGEAQASLTIEALASDAIVAMQEMQDRGPYLVAGFSLGGLIAYEIASQLERAGKEVALLALFDTTAPRFEPHFPLGERMIWRGQRLLADRRQERTGRTRVAEAPQIDEQSTVSRFAKAHRHALRASIKQYVPSRRYQGDLTLFVVRDTARYSKEPTLGWFRWVAGTCHRHDLQVDGHLDILGPNGARELATSLERVLISKVPRTPAGR